jgi:hypothetical protein
MGLFGDHPCQEAHGVFTANLLLCTLGGEVRSLEQSRRLIRGIGRI